jgi:hypothetical protein
MSRGGIIHLRVGQTVQTVANDANVKIFAPDWVKASLQKLLPELKGARFKIGSSDKYWEIKDKFTLKDLVAIARNEQFNTTGVIKFKQYKGISDKTVIALRDLAKHCVIVGKDEAPTYGGYPAGSEIQELNEEVYICDLPGLQFQELNNTGRHVLLTKQNDFPKGSLDDEIYQNTVGQKKPTYQEALQNPERFIKGNFKSKAVLLDTKAFQRFVMQDFILAATSLNAQAKLAKPKDELNFKFLKYGVGFFADGLTGDAKDKLAQNLTKGVLKGLQQFFALPMAMRSQIKRVELPFYKDDSNPTISALLAKINNLCKKHKVEFASTHDDALAQTSSKYKTATTNCSDPHAPTGNEMHYGSVDAAIAENLRRKGNNFSPLCNRKMTGQFVKVDHLPLEKGTKQEHEHEPSGFSKQTLFALAAVALLHFGLSASWAATFSIVILGVAAFELARYVYNWLSATQDTSNKHQKMQDDTALPLTSKHVRVAAPKLVGVGQWKSYSASQKSKQGMQPIAEQSKRRSSLAKH